MSTGDTVGLETGLGRLGDNWGGNFGDGGGRGLAGACDGLVSECVTGLAVCESENSEDESRRLVMAKLCMKHGCISQYVNKHIST